MYLKNENLNLKKYNSYGVESFAENAYFPQTEKELVELLIEYPNAYILGGGNNVILSKPFYASPIIFIRENISHLSIDNNMAFVSAGHTMTKLSDILLNHSMTGFEIFCDIPGTIGGGIVMNAGADSCFIENHIVSVKVFDKEKKQIKYLKKDDCKFGYRTSIFVKNSRYVILSAFFTFELGIYEDMIEKMSLIKKIRENKQPKISPNAGSVFKRPLNYFVGTLIEQAGLKGFSIGDAQISEKHSGFIINKGMASGKDIISLIQHIQHKIFELYNITLELEQIII